MAPAECVLCPITARTGPDWPNGRPRQRRTDGGRPPGKPARPVRRRARNTRRRRVNMRVLPACPPASPACRARHPPGVPPSTRNTIRHHVSRPQSRSERSGALSRRSLSRARRRGQRQDSRDHAEDRAPDRSERFRAAPHRRRHVHEQGGGRNARACVEAAGRQDADHAGQGRPQGARQPAHRLHVPFAGCADPAPGGRARRPEAAVLDHGFGRLLRDDPGAARHDRQRADPQDPEHHLAVEERPDHARRGDGDRGERGRTPGRAGLPQLRGDAPRVPGGRLRRPDPHAGRAVREERAGARPLAEQAALPADRRIPGHQRVPVRAAEAARGPARRIHGGRRRRPGDLRLARRDAREPRAARQGFPEAACDQARAELPVDGADPDRREQRDREQPEAVREEVVVRARDGRFDHRHGVQRRGTRGRVGRVPAVRAQVRAARAVPRLRDPVPRQLPGAHLRAGAAARADSVRAVGRPVVLRQGRDQGSVRVLAADRERRRRSRVHPRGHHAAPRHRQHDAGSARLVRGAGEGVAVRGRVHGRDRGAAVGAPGRAAADVLRLHPAPDRARGQGARDRRARRHDGGDPLRGVPVRRVRRAAGAVEVAERARIPRMAEAQGHEARDGGRRRRGRRFPQRGRARRHGQEPARPDPDRRADVDARGQGRGPGRRAAVDRPCVEGARVSARVPGRRRGRHHAAPRRQRGRRPDRQRADRGGAPADVRRDHPCAAQPAPELVQEAQAGARDGRVRTVALHPGDGARRSAAADAGRGADVAEGPAREPEGIAAEVTRRRAHDGAANRQPKKETPAMRVRRGGF
ncbi:putative LigA [Burkholderia cenocepacia]|nr:putative LigA [Burkholderia cenocepacia]